MDLTDEERPSLERTFSLNGFVCCPACQHHGACLLQWLRGQRGLHQSCCPGCARASECYESIQPDRRVDDDPVLAPASAEDLMVLSLASHAFLCCPECASFKGCDRVQPEDASSGRRCCPRCTHLKECYESVSAAFAGSAT